MTEWLSDSTANRYRQSYVKEFLDVSGNMYVRNGDLDISGGDATISGNVGIGTTSSDTQLTLSKANNTTQQLELRTTGGISDGELTGIKFTQGSSGSTVLGNINCNFFNDGTSSLSLGTRDYLNSMTLTDDGNVGIGTDDPGTDIRLGVYNNAGGTNDKSCIKLAQSGGFEIARNTTYGNYTSGEGGRIYTTFSSGIPKFTFQRRTYSYGDISYLGYFQFNIEGNARAYINNNSSAGNKHLNNFTGQHRNVIDDINTSQVAEYKGLIVCANKDRYLYADGHGEVVTGKEAITINESLPIVSLCSKEQDKTCYGVISDAEDKNDGERVNNSGSFVSVYNKSFGDNRFFINALGEGAIWVSNKNGSFESGDYITTSSISGYGQKQNSEFLANYSVGKITMGCDFNPALQYKKQINRTNIEFFQDISGDYWEDNSGNIYHNSGANYFEDASGNRVFYDKTGKPIYNFKNRPDVMDKDLCDPSGNVVQYTDRNYYRTDTKELLYGYRLETKHDETHGLPYDTNIYKNTKYNLTFNASNNLISVTQNVLDANEEIQWEDTEEQERAYNIRYLDASANILTEEEYNTKKAAGEEAYIAAFVGCTYHCG